MNTDRPRDPLYPKGFEETRELKKQMTNELQKPTKKEEDDELTPLKKLNREIGVYLSPKSIDMTDDEKKKKDWRYNNNNNCADTYNFSILFCNLRTVTI